MFAHVDCALGGSPHWSKQKPALIASSALWARWDCCLVTVFWSFCWLLLEPLALQILEPPTVTRWLINAQVNLWNLMAPRAPTYGVSLVTAQFSVLRIGGRQNHWGIYVANLPKHARLWNLGKTTGNGNMLWTTSKDLWVFFTIPVSICMRKEQLVIEVPVNWYKNRFYDQLPESRRPLSVQQRRCWRAGTDLTITFPSLWWLQLKQFRLQ